MIVENINEIPQMFKRKNLSGNIDFAGKSVPSLTFNSILLPQWFNHPINQKVNLSETLVKKEVEDGFFYKLTSPLIINTWVDVSENSNDPCNTRSGETRKTISLPGSLKWHLLKDDEFLLIKNTSEETKQLWIKGGRLIKEGLTWEENGVNLNSNQDTIYWIIPEFTPLGCWRNRFHSAMCVDENINAFRHQFCSECISQSSDPESCCCNEC